MYAFIKANNDLPHQLAKIPFWRNRTEEHLWSKGSSPSDAFADIRCSDVPTERTFGYVMARGFGFNNIKNTNPKAKHICPKPRRNGILEAAAYLRLRKDSEIPFQHRKSYLTIKIKSKI